MTVFSLSQSAEFAFDVCTRGSIEPSVLLFVQRATAFLFREEDWSLLLRRFSLKIDSPDFQCAGSPIPTGIAVDDPCFPRWRSSPACRQKLRAVGQTELLICKLGVITWYYPRRQPVPLQSARYRPSGSQSSRASSWSFEEGGLQLFEVRFVAATYSTTYSLSIISPLTPNPFAKIDQVKEV